MTGNDLFIFAHYIMCSYGHVRCQFYLLMQSFALLLSFEDGIGLTFLPLV